MMVEIEGNGSIDDSVVIFFLTISNKQLRILINFHTLMFLMVSNKRHLQPTGVDYDSLLSH